MSETRYIAGLYLRLSKDDERAGESVSIENQRLLLTNYVYEKGWDIRETYIDDGWSGTNFQRPAFQRMMRDAEDKRINLIIVKDLSRLGRNYIEVGRLTEDILPQLGCRFIALNDSVDSMLGDNDMMAYRNLFNEFHSKDTSKKVRAVKLSCMKQGKFLGTYAPFGYRKDPMNKHHLVIDEDTAHIVRRIFEMRCGGASSREIAITLNEELIPSPKAIYYDKAGRDNPLFQNGLWGDSSVKAILRNEAYLGHMVQGKYGTVSYKNHKLVNKPKEEWVRVENTHEPLVNLYLWSMARELETKRFKPRKFKGEMKNIFIGILKCADCGFNMRANVRKNTRKDGSVNTAMDFVCGNYTRSGKSACTIHTINNDVLIRIVSEEIRSHAVLIEYDEQRVMDAILQAKKRETTAYLATYRRELKVCEERLLKLDEIIATLYEDKVAGVVVDSMFAALMQKYKLEREERVETVQILQRKVEACEVDSGNVNEWINHIRKYVGLETLTQKILLELIESIDIFERKKINGQRVCKIKITYRFIGNLDNAFAELNQTEGGAAYEQAI
ncbi:MAG: recombinase family protein [Defluviitaleaceae bacterium]|nr:recombinase family protein [Defluviitaleaceae bacterium]